MTLAIRVDHTRIIGRDSNDEPIKKTYHVLVPVEPDRAYNELNRVRTRNPEARLIEVKVRGWR